MKTRLDIQYSIAPAKKKPIADLSKYDGQVSTVSMMMSTHSIAKVIDPNSSNFGKYYWQAWALDYQIVGRERFNFKASAIDDFLSFIQNQITMNGSIRELAPCTLSPDEF